MPHKLATITTGLAAVLAALTIALSGTAMADPSYVVTGTGALGVRVHDAPSASDATAFGILPDGSAVDVVCQTYGEPVTDPVTGFTSNIWDNIVGGVAAVYISDLYVNTPLAGGFSPGIRSAQASPTRVRFERPVACVPGSPMRREPGVRFDAREAGP